MPLPEPPQAVPHLRVATYNVRDLLDDVPAVERVLAALAADVVCLQEVPRHVVGDLRTARLAGRAGYLAPRTHALGGGTTVLWRPGLDRVAVRHVPLRVPLAQRRRGCAVLDLRVEGLPVRVVSVHLGLQPVQRVRHAEHVRTLVGDGAHVVVAGDLNEPVTGSAARRIGLEPLGTGAATYPADAPHQAIDVVLGRGWGSAVERAVDAPREWLRGASDHLPRVLDLAG